MAWIRPTITSGVTRIRDLFDTYGDAIDTAHTEIDGRLSQEALAQSYAPIGSTGGVSDAVGAGMDLIVTLGQSNSKGTNSDYDLANIDVPDSRIFAYQGSGPNANAIAPASARLYPPAIDAIGGISHSHTFAKLWLSQAPAGRRALIVPCGVGGTGFDSWATPAASWKPGLVQNGVTNLYEYAITQINAALAAAGPNSRVIAILWHQGEADSNASPTEAAYAANLDSLIDGLRTRIASLAGVPFIVGQMAPERIAQQTGTAGVNAAHLNTPSRKALTGFAAGVAGFCAADNTHYLAQGQRLLAAEMFRAYFRALANVKGTPPVAPASVSMATENTTTTITWPGSIGRVIDYLIETQAIAGGSWTAVTHTAGPISSITVTGSTPPVAARVSAVNEIGTSAPRATPAVSTGSGGPSGSAPDAPGAPTIVTPSATSLLAAVPPVAGAPAGYVWQYRIVGASTWTAGGTTTDRYQAFTGLTTDTAYEVRATATNANGSSPTGAIGSARTSNAQTAVALGRAHGLRRVVTGYTGPLIRVRRGSDQAEQDIGQNGLDLSLGDLADFVGSASAYIVRIYDQSGNGRNMVQTTAANQPRIVNAGVVDKFGSRPTPVYDGTANYLLSASSGAYAAGAMTMMAVTLSDFGLNASGRLFGEFSSAAAQQFYQVVEASGGTLAMSARNDGSTTILTEPSAQTPSIATSALVQISVRDDGSTVRRWKDNTVIGTDQAYTRAGVFTLNQSAIGAMARNTVQSYWKGRIAELNVAYSALSDTDRQAIQAAQKAYYATA